MEIFGPIKLRGSLADGTGDELVTKDASTDELGTAANALGSLTEAYIYVGDATNLPVGVAVSGDITLSNAGVVAIATGVIVNADINASAAIAVSKLAALTASRAIVSDASGFISASSVTATELGYVSGVTSALQTQIAAKQATITGAATTIASSDLTVNRAVIAGSTGKIEVSAVTSTELGYVSGVTSAIQTQLDTKFAATIASVAEGDILMYNGSNWVNLPRGTNGQALYSTATTVQWDTPTINGIPVGGTDGQVLTKQSGTDFDADWETLTTASITDITASAAEINILDGVTATTAELNYTDGVTSAIQTQLDDKLGKTLPQNSIFVGNSSNIATALAGGTNGYVLTSVSGVPTWAASSAGTPPGSDTQMIFNDAGSFGTDAGFTYDKTTNTLTVPNLETATTIGSAYIHRVGGTDVAVTDGGTGLSAISALSLLVANSANTFVEVTPGAGNSIRVNAGGTAWEAYTPSGIGGSTGAADNALLRADGTGGSTVQAGSAVTLDDSGVMRFGTLNGAEIGVVNIKSNGSDIAIETQGPTSGGVTDPQRCVLYMKSVATTDATVTTIFGAGINPDEVHSFVAKVTARRTGGVSGTDGDGAFYIISYVGTANSVGTVTIIGSPTIISSYESQAGWNVSVDTIGVQVRLRVTGATNNNISWYATIERTSISG